MAVTTKNYLDLTGLQAYDALVKTWANSVNQVAYKTVAKSTDGNSLLFFKKANAVVGTDTPDATIALGSSDLADQLDKLAAIAGATWDATEKKYSITLDSTFDADTKTIVAALNELKGQINTLNGTESQDGSVAKAIKDKIETLDTTADVVTASVDTDNVVTLTAGIKEEDGIIAKGSGTDITLAPVAKTGKAENLTVDAIAGVTGNNAQAVLEDLKEQIDDANADSEVILESVAGGDSDTFSTKYTLYQGRKGEDGKHTEDSKTIGEITIAKDMVVKSGSVKVVEKDDEPYSGAKIGDKYIDLVIANATNDHIYIPVKDLVDVYTGGENAEAKVTVAADNTISVEIKKIAASKIDYTTGDDGETVADALTRLDGAKTVTGSVAQKIDAAIDALDTAADVPVITADATAGTVTILGSVKEENGIIAAGTADGATFGSIATADINALFS